MNFEHILVSVADKIGCITVNRPQVLNAIDRQSVTELQAAFDQLLTDDAARVIVLTGAGERAFISGGDIRDEILMDANESYLFSRLGHRLIQTMETSPKPVIAAINGYALGGGMELILGCDFRIAAENARFGVPEIKLGTTCGFGGTTRLPRIIGRTKAKELLMQGGMMDAAEAFQFGLLNKVVPQGELMAETMKMAAALSKMSAFSLAMSKRMVDWSMDAPLGLANQMESGVFSMAGMKKDKIEGMQAFIDKRPPIFTDE